MFDRYDAGEQAVLVHIYFTQDKDMEDLQEFESLVSSAGVEALQVITGSRKAPHPKYFVGEGKAVEIAEAVKATGASVVLFDHALSPAQERNLERLCECRVIDRTGLILDIFAQRARTHEGKLQVELAQLRHLDDALRDKAAVWEGWLARLPGWAAPMPTASYGIPNRWLTVVTLSGRDPLRAVAALAARGIESRPLWKPMHLQPVFRGCPAVLNGVGERLFAQGLCLPSGRGLSPEIMDETVEILERL